MPYRIVRSILFALSQDDAEKAHTLTIQAAKIIQTQPFLLKLVAWWFEANKNPRPATVAGITFPNRMGLAAGFDKEAEIVLLLQALGFGFVEVGTVLPAVQQGNERPRLFRIPQEQAIINRMGFNSRGVHHVLSNLQQQQRRLTIPVGVSLGKMKQTLNENAVQDYIFVWTCLRRYAAYAAANISSPNTPGLRELQGSKYIERFVRELVEAERGFASQSGEQQKPMLIKLAPDLTESELRETIGACEGAGASGFIIGNTTLSRPLKEPHSPVAKEAGGLSGNPLYPLTLAKFKVARKVTKLPIIFVGGLNSKKRFEEVFKEGADLVQIYTGLIYQGPALVSAARSAA
ncbi:MAG TPA: quinone-dependent dihydroorotate dehydrogenase [Candidatus Paceibacterota bacterium]|nr:quinone-dependent dihydroorotate dehydrogenase [Candidatus Paceibacterota bacterium]